MPNSPHTKNPGQMRAVGGSISSSGLVGPVYRPGDLVVFGPPPLAGCGHHAVIPGLQLQLSTPPVPVDWGTAGMVVLHRRGSALPEVCILVKGFVGWATSAAVYPIDDWTRVIPGFPVDPDWPSETTGSSGQ